MTSELWVPQGARGHSVSSAGHNAETGESVQSHEFIVKDSVTGKKQKFKILADETTSQAHLEDMVSYSVDNWLREVRGKDHKPAPTPEQRKEIGKIIDEIRRYRIKRNSSSSGVIYFDRLGGGNYGHRDKRTRRSRSSANKG